MTDQEFQRIVTYVKGKSGINLTEKRVMVQGRLNSYMNRKGYTSYNEFMDKVEKHPTGPEAEELMNTLTTNHKFFRSLREKQKTGAYGVLLLRQVRNPIRLQCFAKIFWDLNILNGILPYLLQILIQQFLRRP